MGRQARMRKLREEDLEELLEQARGASRQTETAPQAPKAATPADKALELQKTAGNRAVGAALSRWALPWVPRRPRRWRSGRRSRRCIVDGTVVPLEAWNDAGRSPAGGAGTGQQSTRRRRARARRDHRHHRHGRALRPTSPRRRSRARPTRRSRSSCPTKDGKGIRVDARRRDMISNYSVSRRRSKPGTRRCR